MSPRASRSISRLRWVYRNAWITLFLAVIPVSWLIGNTVYQAMNQSDWAYVPNLVIGGLLGWTVMPLARVIRRWATKRALAIWREDWIDQQRETL